MTNGEHTYVCYMRTYVLKLHTYLRTGQTLRAPIAKWIGELTRNPLGFLLLWSKPRSGHIWES